MNLLLNILNRVARFNVKGDCFSCQGLDENLKKGGEEKEKKEEKIGQNKFRTEDTGLLRESKSRIRAIESASQSLCLAIK